MSEQMQMDDLAYSSKMTHWAPLGKLLLTLSLLSAGLMSNNLIVPAATFSIGLVIMTYSAHIRLPRIILLALAEALVIIIIGCGMISILGDPSHPGILFKDVDNVLWIKVHITAESFNKAWLIFFRAVAGMVLMLAFATSTPIPLLAQSLRRLRVPKEIVELVVLTYRYSFLLLERTEVLYHAAKCRLGFCNTRKGVATTASIALNVFISSMDIADRAMPALESRNYKGSFTMLRTPKRAGLKWMALSVAAFVCLYAAGLYLPSPDMASILLGA